MEASVVDLRYHMNDVLKALKRNESVSVLYRGKVKGVIQPAVGATARRVRDHAFFDSRASRESVEKTMERLRGGRYRDL
ncbi:MAG: type II toxin-antitoxin system Phd/YefM family antitoxin [Lentisphaerae bacterium]|nr:type II toxin-antitoxin system Phd/YefM family antitoxin [Lentisphaerota bacterium]